MLPKIKELEAIKLKLEEQKREEEREIQRAIEEQTKQFQQLKQDIKEMQKRRQTEEVSRGAAPPQVSPSVKTPMIIAFDTEMLTITESKKHRNIAASISIVEYVGGSPSV